MALLQQLEGKM